MDSEKISQKVSWTNGKLHINSKKYVYIFYKSHILRIILLLLIIAVAFRYTISTVFKEYSQVIWQEGDLYTTAAKVKNWQKTSDSHGFLVQAWETQSLG